jgi:hypothetical protein
VWGCREIGAHNVVLEMRDRVMRLRHMGGLFCALVGVHINVHISVYVFKRCKVADVGYDRCAIGLKYGHTLKVYIRAGGVCA